MLRNRIERDAINQSERGATSLENRRRVLTAALNVFNTRLSIMPDKDRQEVLDRFYKQITDVVFDHHLAVEKEATKSRIIAAGSSADKVRALSEFRKDMEQLLKLHNCS